MTVYTSSSSRLHPPEVMLIRHLKIMGWSDYQIWKDYHIPITVIQKANKDIERQAVEEFDNKDKHEVELGDLYPQATDQIDHFIIADVD